MFPQKNVSSIIVFIDNNICFWFSMLAFITLMTGVMDAESSALYDLHFKIYSNRNQLLNLQ